MADHQQLVAINWPFFPFDVAPSLFLLARRRRGCFILRGRLQLDCSEQTQMRQRVVELMRPQPRKVSKPSRLPPASAFAHRWGGSRPLWWATRGSTPSANGTTKRRSRPPFKEVPAAVPFQPARARFSALFPLAGHRQTCPPPSEGKSSILSHCCRGAFGAGLTLGTC